MAKNTENQSSLRLTRLRNLLTRLREKEAARVSQLRADEAGSTVTEPSDSLEVARASEEFELHADLAARSEDRLDEIHAAFERLDAGTYGICEKCHREIELARLRALPFAKLCADCQKAAGTGREQGSASEEFSSRWSAPEGMAGPPADTESVEPTEGNGSQSARQISAPASARPAPPRTRAKKPRGRKRR